MGKRTKDKTEEEIKTKIRRLEKELASRNKSPTPGIQYGDPEYDSSAENEPCFDGSGSGEAWEDDTCTPAELPESVVVMPSSTPDPTKNDTIPSEVLALLGEAKQSEESFGPKIPAEVSERWGKILLEGLTREQKQNLLSKTQVPENFQLAKAPKLNAEVSSVLNEPSRNRDKRLEKMQNQLGLGIAGLANLTSELISKDVAKMDIIKQIAEVNQILLDLHYEETMNRRRLLIPMLDKSFITIIQGVKREKFLFGDNLTENIKTTKSLEKSSLQIKKSIPVQTRKPNAPGNVRAPLRQVSGQGTARAHNEPARYYSQPPQPASRRVPPVTRRRAPPPASQPQSSRWQDRRGRR